MLRKIIFPVLLGIAGCGVLVWLGLWQIDRLAWKEDILATINGRLAADPAPFATDVTEAEDEYARVMVSGTPTGQELHVLVSGTAAGTGYRVISRFETDDGLAILLDQGLLPLDAKDSEPLLAPMDVTGTLLWPDDQNSSTPEPDLAANIWFARNVETMAEALDTLPLMVVATATTPADPRLTALPVATADIKNDHFAYAVTWFLLAIVWAVMSLFLILRTLRPKGRLIMRYISTRGTAPVLTFEQAMLTGLARDGGLYLPEDIPTLTHAQIAAMAGKSYEDVAFDVMRPFIGDTFTDAQFRDLIARAYAGFGHAARAPLVQVDSNHYLLELFHGPTLAFKDFAMQLIGQMFQAALSRSGDRVTIVGATSGDTGSAAIEAFRGLKAVDVFILYPHGRVSEVQRRQMTTPTEANVHALAVNGDFDDCQALVKDMFNDFAFRDDVRLAGVNSINWGRVLAQVVYYFTAAVSLGAPHRPVSFTVPTGNFGDIFAGFIAKRMGLPIADLVVATNRNDILHRTLLTGAYTKEGVTPTISPSMDIQVSSNFERALFYAYGQDGAAVASQMEDLKSGGFTISQGAYDMLTATFKSGRASEEETSATIKTYLAQHGELLCPHTAVGAHVAQAHLGSIPMVTLATAHPAKFPDAVKAASGISAPLPARMADLYDRPERVTPVAADLAALQAVIKERIIS